MHKVVKRKKLIVAVLTVLGPANLAAPLLLYHFKTLVSNYTNVQKKHSELSSNPNGFLTLWHKGVCFCDGNPSCHKWQKICYFKKLPFRNFISPVKARNLWRVLTANGICVCKSAPLSVPPSLSALGPDCGSPWGQPGPSGFDYFTLGIPPAMASCAQELVLAWTVWELDGWALSSSAWGKFWLILAPALLKSRC